MITGLLFSCSDIETEDLPDYEIAFGSECGWCAGQEYISLSGSVIQYTRNIPCGDNKGTVVRTRELSSADWEKITNSFDYSLFRSLEYNQCNVCVDGCDEILRIRNDNDEHELRYSFSDEVEGMETLRTILKDFLEEMRGMQ